MIPRSRSLKRDLMTGTVLVKRHLTWRPGLFKKRAYSWSAVFGLTSVALVPMTIMFGAGAAYCWGYGEYDKVEQFAWFYCLLGAAILWLARGSIAYDLGGTGSETD